MYIFILLLATTSTTSELLWKAISLVGQKILKRLFILNVAALKGSGLVAKAALAKQTAAATGDDNGGAVMVAWW